MADTLLVMLTVSEGFCPIMLPGNLLAAGGPKPLPDISILPSNLWTDKLDSFLPNSLFVLKRKPC